MTDTFVQDTTGIFLPRPTTRQVTMIRLVNAMPDIQVVENIDDVRDRLEVGRRDEVVRFTDVFGEPVDIYPYAQIAATYLHYIDDEEHELSRKEHEVNKRLRSANITQASFDAAKATRHPRRLN